MIVVQQSMDASSVSQTNEIADSSEADDDSSLQQCRDSIHRGSVNVIY